MFCAGERGRNPCKGKQKIYIRFKDIKNLLVGDSGSGFYVKKDTTWSILGVTSAAATSDCQDNKFVLFSNVPNYIPWIEGLWIQNDKIT